MVRSECGLSDLHHFEDVVAGKAAWSSSQWVDKLVEPVPLSEGLEWLGAVFDDGWPAVDLDLEETDQTLLDVHRPVLVRLVRLNVTNLALRQPASRYTRHFSPETSNIHIQPFYGSLDFVQDNSGEPVPEGTFRHLLDFLEQNEDNTGRCTNNLDGLPPLILQPKNIQEMDRPQNVPLLVSFNDISVLHFSTVHELSFILSLISRILLFLL